MGCECLRGGDSEWESDAEAEVEEAGKEEAEDIMEEDRSGSLNGAHPDRDGGWEGVENEGKELEVVVEEIDMIEQGKEKGRGAEN